MVASKLKITSLGWCEYRVMAGDDLPFGRAILQLLLDIFGLWFQIIVRVEDDDPNVLIIHCIDALVKL